MFERFKNILRATVNQQISKMETPEVLAEEAEAKMNEDLKKISEALTDGVATTNILKDRIAKNKEQITVWEERAKLAVEKNNDDVAKQSLQKKLEYVQDVQRTEAQLAEQVKTNQELKAKHAELQAHLKEFSLNKQKIVAQLKGEGAVSKMNELLSGSSGMDHWEDKVNHNAARAKALEELAEPEQLAKNFEETDQQKKIEDELSSIKGQIGGIKIIEDKNSDS